MSREQDVSAERQTKLIKPNFKTMSLGGLVGYNYMYGSLIRISRKINIRWIAKYGKVYCTEAVSVSHSTTLDSYR
jgi:hypothetical protein